MLTKDKIINYITDNRDILSNEYHINKIGLFGSFVNGEANKNSDIDIIVEFDENADDLFEIKTKLSELFKKKFNRNVDIAREKYIKSRVKDRILKEVIYVE